MLKINKITFFSCKLLLMVGLVVGLGVKPLSALISIKSIHNIASILREDKQHLSPLCGYLFLNLKYLDFIESSNDPSLKLIQNFLKTLFYRHQNGKLIPSVSISNVFHVMTLEAQKKVLDEPCESSLDQSIASEILEGSEKVEALDIIEMQEKEIINVEQLIGLIICEIECAYKSDYKFNSSSLIKKLPSSFITNKSFLKKFKEFLRILQRAFEYEKSSKRCLPHIIQYILLSYLWCFSEGREGLFEYFKVIPDDYFKESNKQGELEVFLQQAPYTKDEASSLDLPKSFEEMIIKVWKKMVFLVPFPPVIQFKRILYRHNKLGVDVEYTNCVEISLQNIFNAALYDADKQIISIDALKAIAKEDTLSLIEAYEQSGDITLLRINEDDAPHIKFIKFYLAPGSISKCQTQEAALQWAKVTQDIALKTLPETLINHLNDEENLDVGNSIYIRPNPIRKGAHPLDMWIDSTTNQKMSMQQINAKIRENILLNDPQDAELEGATEIVKFYEMEPYPDLEFYNYIIGLFLDVRSIKDMFNKVNAVHTEKNKMKLEKVKYTYKKGNSKKDYMVVKISKGLSGNEDLGDENKNLHVWEWVVSRDHSEVQPCYLEKCDYIDLSMRLLKRVQKFYTLSSTWFTGVLSKQNIFNTHTHRLNNLKYVIPTLVMRSNFGDQERLAIIKLVHNIWDEDLESQQLIELCNYILEHVDDAGNEYIEADNTKKNCYLSILAQLCCMPVYFETQTEVLKKHFCTQRKFFNVMTILHHMFNYDFIKSTNHTEDLWAYLLKQEDFVTHLIALIPEDNNDQEKLILELDSCFRKQYRLFIDLFKKLEAIQSSDQMKSKMLNNFARKVRARFEFR